MWRLCNLSPPSLSLNISNLCKSPAFDRQKHPITPPVWTHRCSLFLYLQFETTLRRTQYCRHCCPGHTVIIVFAYSVLVTEKEKQGRMSGEQQWDTAQNCEWHFHVDAWTHKTWIDISWFCSDFKNLHSFRWFHTGAWLFFTWRVCHSNEPYLTLQYKSGTSSIPSRFFAWNPRPSTIVMMTSSSFGALLGSLEGEGSGMIEGSISHGSSCGSCSSGTAAPLVCLSTSSLGYL